MCRFELKLHRKSALEKKKRKQKAKAKIESWSRMNLRKRRRKKEKVEEEGEKQSGRWQKTKKFPPQKKMKSDFFATSQDSIHHHQATMYIVYSNNVPTLILPYLRHC